MRCGAPPGGENRPLLGEAMKHKITFILAATSAAIVAAPFLVSSADATQTVTQHFTVPGHATVDVLSDQSWCDNTGPHITLSSDVSLGGFGVELTFKNNVKGTHTYQTVGQAELSLVSNTGSSSPQINKQPPLGGVGGNPWIYYVDPTGAGFFIGRCVQDGKIGVTQGHFSTNFDVAAFSTLTVSSLSCSNKGSSLSIGSDNGTGDVNGKLVFANSNLGLNPQHINDSDVGASWSFTEFGAQHIKKGGNVGGPGGNPLVGSDVGAGADISSFVAFGGTHTDYGRCNQI
jgi:hypothetical protein